MSETYSAEEFQVARRIALAIARDVKAEDMPQEWNGLDPQDADQIPEGMDAERIETIARRIYHAAMADPELEKSMRAAAFPVKRG